MFSLWFPDRSHAYENPVKTVNLECQICWKKESKVTNLPPKCVVHLNIKVGVLDDV